MTIRLATLADIPYIMLLIKDVVPLMRATGNLQWSDDYPNPEVFERDISLNQLWVADIDDAIAGVIAITHDQSEEYTQAGWDITEQAIVTHRLAVSPHYRGRGIAEQLLNKAEEEAIRQNIPLLRIDTNTNNQATQKLFPKLGYTYSGEISLNFRPGLRFLCYEKRL
ncbi:GNAT family N-acetyltransferase [Mucilaginibacter glaciei]|uniref:GNAT family N-acetyltransferase n=1 Tax=Mucilaginibacter glaciei TaxID=2772109 RepID=A0A926S3T6_9SPHI|nr:GNAT family N-acetyltransferase [Mucilaginibacter glaciei]MBD1394584.1 GNAT family N-acetyltransferase [Mucilaginibacter glaciei]